MQKHPTPTELYRAAKALWPPAERWDEASLLIRRIEAQHLTGTTPPPLRGQRRPTNWVRTLHEHEQFWRDHLHAPRERTRNMATLPQTERLLGEWARYQRRTEPLLARYQVLRLDVSPSFAWDPQQRAWISNFDACHRYLRKTGTLPYLNSAAPEQFALARWLGRQLRHQQAGTLAPDRAALLQSFLDDSQLYRRAVTALG
ncbi:MAG: helicase associated domain-containing protein [Kineosporiaceae bacterium]|nr:helicase associated domain-containing protein [Aeromicrobium sp.]